MRAKIQHIITLTLLLGTLVSCGQSAKKQKTMEEKEDKNTNLAVATFGTGCFWCTEAMFVELKGVEKVVSGYSGGFVDNPTYEDVCTKKTGHIECAKISYDPKQVSYVDLLEAFFRCHDATSKDKQGNDSGPQYRSAIFYYDDEQKALADVLGLNGAAIVGRAAGELIDPHTRLRPMRLGGLLRRIAGGQAKIDGIGTGGDFVFHHHAVAERVFDL